MIRTILVHTRGFSADDSVFSTALTMGAALGAHLDFYQCQFTAQDAAARDAHLQFCVGPEINRAMQKFESIEKSLMHNAVGQFEEFCRANGVVVTAEPNAETRLSASFTQELGHAERRVLLRVRHRDLALLGRPTDGDCSPYGLIETLLIKSGRPLLIAPEAPRTDLLDTIVVGWKETAESARAVAAAMPLLKAAKQVVVVHVVDNGSLGAESEDLIMQLAWHGISATFRQVAQQSTTAAALLGVASEHNAGLIVVGGYGHGALREATFGGVTRSMIEQSAIPVLLVH